MEFYGDAGTLGRSPTLSQQLLLVSPVAVGELDIDQIGRGHAGKLEYELGWLFGATAASSAGTLRWRAEVKLPF